MKILNMPCKCTHEKQAMAEILSTSLPVLGLLVWLLNLPLLVRTFMPNLSLISSRAARLN
jgi:hypothetical protein